MASLGILIALLVSGGASWAAMKRASRKGQTVADAEARLDEDDLDGATRASESALPSSSGFDRYRLLMVLGLCAERRGDLRSALTTFDLALDVLKFVSRVTDVVVEARVITTGHRAFALAALDEVDAAEAALATIASAVSTFESGGPVVRARALIAWKRKQGKELLDLLERERATIRATMGRRDRALLGILAMQTRATFGHALRAPSAPMTFHDPRIVRWLGAVVPETRHLLGSRS